MTTIGEAVFYGCSSLNSVTIGENVTDIDGRAFNCENLSTIISLIKEPFAIYGKLSVKRTFHLNTFDNATLYVPAGTIEKYKATDGWKDFVNIVDPYDLNSDGKISAGDIQVIINDMKKEDSEQNMMFDLNGDGKISTADIQVLINEMKK